MTAPHVAESRRDRLRRKAAEDLEQLEADGEIPPPRGSHRDPTRRWREERDAELARDRDRGQERGADRASHFWKAATDLEEALNANRPSSDPFFVQQPADPPVPQRPLGPTSRGGVRHNDPYREGSPANPSFEQVKDWWDPLREESQLYRSLAHARYKSALAPLVFGPGQTIAKLLFRVPDLLHRLPWDRAGSVGKTIDKGLAAWEQDLGSRIARDEAREYVVRERHMTPAERLAQDLLRFGAEFEMGTRAFAPALRAAPPLRATPAGASLPTRFLYGARRVGTRAAAEGSQFGLFETGRSFILPKFLKVPQREAPR